MSDLIRETFAFLIFISEVGLMCCWTKWSNHSKLKHCTFCWASSQKIIWAASWQNQQNGICTQRRVGSAWASAESDQSLCCLHEESGSLATHWAHSEDCDQIGRVPRLIWVFAGCTDHFVDFVMRWLNYAPPLDHGEMDRQPVVEL